MPNIFLTSDTHYHHEDISNPYTSKWKNSWRNYNSLQDHDEDIVKQINRLVTEDDVLYHLGDWSFGGIESIWQLRKQLRCKTVHLILGNYDHHIAANKLIKIPASDRARMMWLGIGWDYTKDFNGFSYVPAQNLFDSVELAGVLKHGKHTVFMSHYAHRVWEGSHKGVLHVYGHSHGSIDDYGKSMDVGVDVAHKLFGEYRPFHIDEIISILNKREIAFPDHQ